MALGLRKDYLRYKSYFLNIVSLYKRKEDLRMFLEIMLSLHVCGKWAREVSKGDWSFVHDLTHKSVYVNWFDRVQLNFAPYIKYICDADWTNPEKIDFLQGISVAAKTISNVQFIFQMGDFYNRLSYEAQAYGANAVSFLDGSGGQGKLPENWNTSTGYCGYAGGLSPENLHEQISLIFAASNGNPFWIDVETGVRTNNLLNMTRVRKFLEICANHNEL